MSETIRSVAINRLVLMVATAVATAVGTTLATAYPAIYEAVCAGALT